MLNQPAIIIGSIRIKLIVVRVFITVDRLLASVDSYAFRTLDMIKSYGKKAGVALNPATPLSAIENVLSEIDLLLVMTVNPGFGGQHYIESMTPKIQTARQMLNAAGRTIELQVDGGVKAENVRMVAEAGASMVVMGTAVFPSDDYVKKLGDIRKRLE